jgi:uncharacterized membrane protein SpoIIM required for sporulation/uncharacterized RDD family membrane protein YckC
MTPPPDYRQHLLVETPEHIILDYEIAGLGSRALAALIDTAVLALWTAAVLAAYALLGFKGSPWLAALLLFGYFVSLWGYFTFFESLRAGQTPGKRLVGIRVVLETGHPVTFGAAAARNLLRIADFLPPPYLIGALFVAFHPRARRLGDFVGGTVVVRDRPMEIPATRPPGAAEAPADLGSPLLSDEEFRLLREFQDRSASLPPEVRGRLAGRLAERFAGQIPRRDAAPQVLITRLHDEERARRQGRFHVRRPGAGSVAERIVARKQARWREFERLAERSATHGLDHFDADELPDFAARYREVAADLARARTYHADAATCSRLERLVAAGHNALYRDERHTLRRIWETLTRECPAALVPARRYVLVAMAAFWLPAAGGYLLVHQRPSLAEEVLPDVMLRRAEAGKSRLEEGKGYVEVGAQVRPLVASGIISNNLTVAFSCFAGGIFLGVGSLLMLAYNGLSIGATASHFANQGLLLYLLTFIVGHGLLELTAIWIAGAAGFLLGRSVVAPGDLPRSEALASSGRLALRLIGLVIVLLLVAGMIEGFLSTSRHGLGYRLAVSVASLVFLLLLVLNGWRYRSPT